MLFRFSPGWTDWAGFFRGITTIFLFLPHAEERLLLKRVCLFAQYNQEDTLSVSAGDLVPSIFTSTNAKGLGLKRFSPAFVCLSVSRITPKVWILMKFLEGCGTRNKYFGVNLDHDPDSGIFFSTDSDQP